MAYTINLTDGTILATVADGTVDTTSCSMALVGKNYAGYGEFLDENFVHLLENSSNSTAPGAPLTGQLWWNNSTDLLQVWTGATWKTISAATSSSSAPTNNVTGDLWWDTTNQQLKVYNGTSFTLIGPSFNPDTGETGAIPDTISDGSTNHIAIKFFVNNQIVAIMSRDAVYTPSPSISGFTTISPGMNMATSVGGQSTKFVGTATNAELLDGIGAGGFLSATSNDTTTGTLGILNDSGLSVGVDNDARVSVSPSTSAVTIANQTSGANLILSVNVGGTPTAALTVYGANGTVAGNQINANYADVAERFAADEILEPGTVVELGGSAEITKVQQDLSDSVFGVISTRAAYLMNSRAGTDETHPPVAMTGRVPVKVIGTVRKGDRLVSAGNGLARSARAGEATAFNVIGRSLYDKLDSAEGVLEAIVTIK